MTQFLSRCVPYSIFQVLLFVNFWIFSKFFLCQTFAHFFLFWSEIEILSVHSWCLCTLTQFVACSQGLVSVRHRTCISLSLESVPASYDGIRDASWADRMSEGELFTLCRVSVCFPSSQSLPQQLCHVVHEHLQPAMILTSCTSHSSRSRAHHRMNTHNMVAELSQTLKTSVGQFSWQHDPRFNGCHSRIKRQ